MKNVMVFVVMAVLLSSMNALAAVPRTINYQARITDLSGNAVVNGTHAVTIRLYQNKTDAEAASIWADSFTVQTQNGYFSVLLGSSIPFAGTVDFNQQYWLGLRVDTDPEMTERQPLNSTPYSQRAEYANQIANGAVDVQAKAPWAPVVWRQGTTSGNYPKIIYGSLHTTDGNFTINIPAGTYTETPIFIATMSVGVGVVCSTSISQTTITGRLLNSVWNPAQGDINYCIIGK